MAESTYCSHASSGSRISNHHERIEHKWFFTGRRERESVVDSFASKMAAIGRSVLAPFDESVFFSQQRQTIPPASFFSPRLKKKKTMKMFHVCCMLVVLCGVETTTAVNVARSELRKRETSLRADPTATETSPSTAPDATPTEIEIEEIETNPTASTPTDTASVPVQTDTQATTQTASPDPCPDDREPFGVLKVSECGIGSCLGSTKVDVWIENVNALALPKDTKLAEASGKNALEALNNLRNAIPATVHQNLNPKQAGPGTPYVGTTETPLFKSLLQPVDNKMKWGQLFDMCRAKASTIEVKDESSVPLTFRVTFSRD